MKRFRKSSKENFQADTNAYGLPIDQYDSRQVMLSISNSEVHIHKNNDLSNITNTYGGLDHASYHLKEDPNRSFNYKSRFGRHLTPDSTNPTQVPTTYFEDNNNQRNKSILDSKIDNSEYSESICRYSKNYTGGLNFKSKFG